MLQEEIDKECRKYGKKLAIYMKANLEEALQKEGKSVQEASLTFNEVVTQTQDGVKIQIIATDEYWINIEKGRKKGSMPPSDALGKQWQNKHNINAKEVYLEIQANYQRKNGLSTTNRKLSKPKKTLSYNDYAKRLSFIFARIIERKGIEAKPFVQQALKEAKVDEFQKRISEIIGKDMRVQLQLNNSNIKLNF